MELWKDIDGYDGMYKVSNIGRVYSCPKYRHKGKILKLHICKNGYLTVGLSKNKKRKNFLVHRLVGMEFVPNIDKKPEINHIDGNKKNNNCNNLEWVTSSENQKHSFELGLQIISDKHRLSAKKQGKINGLKNKGVPKISKRKLTPKEDEEIVEKFNNGVSSIKLSEEYGVSKKTILNIKNGRVYKKERSV